jgi:hypothetical protein
MSCAAERRTGRSARMLYEVLGDIWVVSAIPYLQDDLLDNPKRRRSWIEALHHRLHEVEKRRDEPMRSATRKVGSCSRAARDAVRALRAALRRAGPAAAARRLLARHTRADNVRFDAFARVSHVTDATDWRVECRSWC